jgi:putative membrane protein
MRRLLLSAAAIGAMVSMAACHKTGANANQDVTNPGQSAPVNAAQDVAGTAVGMASSAMPQDAQGFVTAATIANMYEIEAAKIAQQRAKSPDVKALAAMIIKDHTQIGKDMDAAVKASGTNVTPPTALDQRRQGMIDNLKAAGDADFDLAYLHQQLAAHMEADNLLKNYRDHGDNDTLKAAAGKAEPIVAHHLDEVKRIGGDQLNQAMPGSNG